MVSQWCRTCTSSTRERYIWSFCTNWKASVKRNGSSSLGNAKPDKAASQSPAIRSSMSDSESLILLFQAQNPVFSISIHGLSAIRPRTSGSNIHIEPCPATQIRSWHKMWWTRVTRNPLLRLRTKTFRWFFEGIDIWSILVVRRLSALRSFEQSLRASQEAAGSTFLKDTFWLLNLGYLRENERWIWGRLFWLLRRAEFRRPNYYAKTSASTASNYRSWYTQGLSICRAPFKEMFYLPLSVKDNNSPARSRHHTHELLLSLWPCIFNFRFVHTWLILYVWQLHSAVLELCLPLTDKEDCSSRGSYREAPHRMELFKKGTYCYRFSLHMPLFVAWKHDKCKARDSSTPPMH
jgi:hypothetical protein